MDGMNINSNQRRRRKELILLCGAVLMFVLGLTVFGSLKGLASLGYWLTCLALTLAAILLAVRDMREIRRQNREEKIELIEKAFDGVTGEVKEAREKRRANS